MNHPDIKRKPNESATDYKYRICKDKDLLGLEKWQDVADILNKEFDNNFSESTYRKWFKNFEEGIRYGLEKYKDNELLEEIENKTIEFQKQKYQYQDQKRELNNLIRQQARFEHLKQEIQKSIHELSKVKPLQFVDKNKYPNLKNKGIALFSDWHYGLEYQNSLGKYNPEVFIHRLEELIIKLIRYGKRHNISELTVASLGDLIHGAIHVSTRVQSSEDVIKQIQHVAEHMSEALARLANEFDEIKFIHVIGNHARLIPNKNESIFRENLEYLIPWYIESRLSQFSNVKVLTDSDGMYIDEVYSDKFVYVHGDLDNVSNATKVLPQMIGIVPKYIFAGHIHQNTVKDYGRTTVITNGSLCGTDDYALSKRYFSKPMQKLLILDGSDIECTYDIYLS